MKRLHYSVPFEGKYFNISKDMGITVFSVKPNEFKNNGLYHLHGDCYILGVSSYYFKDIEYSEHIDSCVIVTSNHVEEYINVDSFYTVSETYIDVREHTLFPYGKVYLKFKNSADYTKYKLKA